MKQMPKGWSAESITKKKDGERLWGTSYILEVGLLCTIALLPGGSKKL